MTWDSSATNSRTTNVDLNTIIQRTELSQGKMSHKFKSSSGETSNFEFMQTAELVFPGLDYLASVPKEESQGLKNKMKRGKLFVDDYLDRKGQAKFVRSLPSPLFVQKVLTDFVVLQAGENPDNLLTKGVNPTFASKYSDPNHPIHSGSIYSLVSLGRFNPQTRRDLGRRATGGSAPGNLISGVLDAKLGRQDGFGARRGGGGRADLLGRSDFSRGGPIGGLFGLVSMAAKAVSERGQESSRIAPSQQDVYYEQQQQRQPSNDRNIGYDEGRQRPMARARADKGPRGIGRLLQQVRPPLCFCLSSIAMLISVQKVLYLMVVNMPTEEEFAQARELSREWDMQN